MVQTPDGGGGGTPPVTSTVTVDPGQITQFAKFLDDMHEELRKVQQRLSRADGIAPHAFGVYAASSAARTKYLTTVRAEADNVADLVRRTQEVTSGTNNVARAYRDLDELNRANAAAISAQLHVTPPTA